MAGQSGGQAAGQTGGQMAGQTGGQVAGQTGGQVAGHTGGQVAGQTGGQRNRQRNGQTDLRQHVHSHGIPCGRNEADVDLPVTQRQRQLLKTSKPAVRRKVSNEANALISQHQTLCY